MSLVNEKFKMKDIGRGIWHLWHSVGFICKNKQDVVHLYENILMYNSVIRCKECGEHSNDYIVKTYDYIVDLFKGDYTDSEIIGNFNIWLYEYHNSANLKSGKTEIPTYQEVIDYYSIFEACESDCAGNN
jgi:hypothetical protein